MGPLIIIIAMVIGGPVIYFERKQIMKKNVFIRTIISIVALFFVLTIGSKYTYADEKAAVEKESGFSYEVIFPENQQGDMGYFYLRMTPGQKQTLEVKLTNSGTEEIEVATTLSGARTNANGVIEYGPNELEKGKSMKFDFSDIVKGPESVKIPGQSTVSLLLEISMPETSYDGLIVGGLQLKRVKNEDEQKSGSGTMVINEYAYTIGVVLKETDIELSPSMDFVKAYGSQISYKNTVIIDLENTAARFLEDLTVEAQVMKKDSEEVLYEAKKTTMRMAPNTILNFPVSMGGELMKAGDYTAHVVATSGENKWEWTENFKITQEEADKFNNEAVGLTQESGIDWKLIAMIVAGVIVGFGVIFLIVFFVRKQKEKKRKELQRKRKKKKKQ